MLQMFLHGPTAYKLDLSSVYITPVPLCALHDLMAMTRVALFYPGVCGCQCRVCTSSNLYPCCCSQGACIACNAMCFGYYRIQQQPSLVLWVPLHSSAVLQDQTLCQAEVFIPV